MPEYIVRLAEIRNYEVRVEAASPRAAERLATKTVEESESESEAVNEDDIQYWPKLTAVRYEVSDVHEAG